MGRYTGPKNKRSRREGVDLFGNGGASLERRLDQPPGMHGRGAAFRRRRRGDYERQLREKQKAKRMYGMRERQFRRFFRMAQRSSDSTGEALLRLLERRLDNVVFRMGWARTRPQARQFVTHGHVRVDGRRVNVPSYLVDPDQTLTLTLPVHRVPEIGKLLDAPSPLPDWLAREGARGRVLRAPQPGGIASPIEMQLIVDFYAR